MEIQTIFELHSDNNKSKYSKDILKFAKKKKKKMKNSTSNKLNFLAKFLT